MAIAVGTTSALTYATRTNSTITAPTGITNGDLLVMVLHAGNASLTALAITLPSGWSAIPNDPTTNAQADPYSIATHVFYKIASSESGNYTFTHGSGETEGIMYRLTGADGTTPLDVTPVKQISAGGGGTQITTYPAITPVTSGAFLVYAESVWDAPGTATIAGTNPTIASRRVGTITWVGDGTQTTAGTIASRTRANGNILGDSWVSTVVAIRPDTGPPAPFSPSYTDWPLRRRHPKLRGAT